MKNQTYNFKNQIFIMKQNMDKKTKLKKEGQEMAKR
jgi:hypothetical protein